MSIRALTAVKLKTVCFAVPILLAGSSFAAQSTAVISNVPAIVTQANDLGRVAPDTEMKVTVWLKPSNSADFDRAVDELYAPGSATYHQWMTEADMANYAVSPADAQKVKKELESYGLTVTPSKSGLGLVARGQAGNVESAFHTQIRNYSLNGQTLRANATHAALQNNASLVDSVSGLAGSFMRPMLVQKKDSETGQAATPRAISPDANGFSAFVTSNCFKGPTAFEFTTPNATLPIGVYFGNVYDQGPQFECGYEPAELQAIYGVDKAISQGLAGDGQTIVILDAFGSPTIQADANLFSLVTGLPALNSSNFQIVYPGGKPVFDPTSADQQGWAVEVALDVEWAHAMAPKAKIVLVAAYSNYNQDFQYALDYITTKHLGDVISNSWSGLEEFDPEGAKAFNTLLKRAAAKGISAHFATGDSGDSAILYGVATPGSPADSPYATAVGGTSLNVPYKKGFTTTGWGNNITLLTKSTGIYDPPNNLGLYFGSGGGESSIFSKPSYQKQIPGSGRQQPDVSAVADPYTGVPIVYTDFSTGTQYAAVYGGTSLATPVFSALWALANEAAGKSLGQAAPIVAKLSSAALTDVVPVTSPTNVFGAVVDSAGYQQYTPVDLVLPVSEPKFVSAFRPLYAGGTTPNHYDVLSFGTDSSLRVEKGWDNVTGFGTPSGLSFFKEAATYK